MVQLLALTSASASPPLRRRPTYHSLLTTHNSPLLTTQVENLLPIYVLHVIFHDLLCATCVYRCNENTLLHVRYSRQDVQLSILPVYHLRLNQTACNDFHQQTKYEYIECHPMAQIQPSQEYKSVVTFIWTGNWHHCDSTSMTEGSILAALSAIVATRTTHCPVPLHRSLSFIPRGFMLRVLLCI